MNKLNDSKVTRRAFLVSASSLLAGYHLLNSPGIFPMIKQKQDLKAEMTPEELKSVGQSVMAKDVKKYFTDPGGYSCAESLLLASLRYQKKPEELVWIAAGFGGGMGHRDLCGFLTAGIMGIGLAAGALDLERTEAKSWCREKVKNYWEWWQKEAPLHCGQVLKLGLGIGFCSKLGQLAAVKIEELVKKT